MMKRDEAIRQLATITTEDGIAVLVPDDGSCVYVDPEVDICNARLRAEMVAQGIEDFKAIVREEGAAFYEAKTEDLAEDEWPGT